MKIIRALFSTLLKNYQREKYGKVSTFTYFIPAPPSRKTGYREKEFDKLILKMSEMGFDILNIQTQEVQDKGIMAIVKLQALSDVAQNASLNIFDESIDLDYNESLEQGTDVEGLYYID